MRILFVTAGGVTDGPARIRLLQYRPAIHRAGDTTAVLPMDGTSRFRVRAKQALAMAMAWRADVVVVQRLASPVLARSLARVNRRVLYDLDDAVFAGCPEVNEAFPVYERVIAGNRLLADHVARFNPNVTVIPSTIDESRFPLADAPPMGADRPVTIGWLGHGDYLSNLMVLRPAMEALAARHPGRVTFKVVSNRPFDFGPGGPPVVNKQWSVDGEPADVRSFDVGVMPLEDNVWNRHKCAYKALLYMSQGIPAVVSPVGVNADIVHDGANGFHATTADDWTDRLSRLLADPALAQRLGRAGRDTVARGFTASAVWPTMSAVLRGTLPPGRTLGSVA